MLTMFQPLRTTVRPDRSVTHRPAFRCGGTAAASTDGKAALDADPLRKNPLRGSLAVGIGASERCLVDVSEAGLQLARR